VDGGTGMGEKWVVVQVWGMGEKWVVVQVWVGMVVQVWVGMVVQVWVRSGWWYRYV